MSRKRFSLGAYGKHAWWINRSFSFLRRRSSCIRRQDPEQTGPCHPMETCPPHHGFGSKLEPCFGRFPVRVVWRVETVEKRRAQQPLAKRDSACFFGHGNRVSFDAAKWAPSIDSSVATNKALESKTWRDRPRLPALNSNGFPQHEPSAPRKLPLNATGTEVQGPLEASQHERFDDALGLATSLTLAAPAAGSRDLTPSTVSGKRAKGTRMQQMRELRPLPKFFETINQDTPTSSQRTF